MPLILTPAQAEAVYSAMCALNNVGGMGQAAVYDPSRHEYIRVSWEFVGVQVARTASAEREDYRDQSAFATAYGLQTGA